MQDWLAKISAWFYDLVQKIFQAIIDLVLDLVAFIIELVLTPIFTVIASIPMPDFLTQYSIGGLLTGVHPMVGYIFLQLRFGEAFAIIASAVLFRLTRKLFTLGQW